MNNINQPIFSVVICTFNRAKYLKACIESILKQTIDKTAYEIIVMDDGSENETIILLQKYQTDFKKTRLRFYKSENIGLAHSRNKAVRLSRGKYVAYIDDDARAEKNWLKNALNKLQSNPAIRGITGPVFPYYINKKPAWFKDEYEADIKGEKSRFLKFGETFSGPNMILERELIKQYKGFAEEIDMKGDILMVGEETKFFERVWQDNPESSLLYYDPEIKVFHLVHPYKIKVLYRLKRWFASGQSYYLRNKSALLIKNIWLFFKVSAYFILKTFTALFSILSHRYYQNWLIEGVGPLAFAFGFFSVYLKLPIIMRQKSRY